MVPVVFFATIVTAAIGMPVELSENNFHAEVFESGKNAFVKFFAPWCGHCKAAKPAWDSLGKEYADHPNVLIGDVDCTVSKELCGEMGVSGYPTIKYWVDGGGKDDAKSPSVSIAKQKRQTVFRRSYNGGRSLDQFKKHVEENMLPKCEVANPEGCDEQEVAYIEKMKSKGSEAAKTELARLEGMKGSAMKPDKKQWLAKRMRILQQL